jgi:galactokinase
LTDSFRELFGRETQHEARAPGRVNLIGEHTDYNGGYVLPTALPQETCVQAARRPDRTVRGVSVGLPTGNTGEYTLGEERKTGTWLDYVQGVTRALAEHPVTFGGFDFLVTSTVPIGKGLSSSASLEIAIARAIRALFALSLTDLELAFIGHKAETEFVGAPVGIMDQMVCSLGDRASALFLDAATARFEKIPLPPDVALGVIDSGIAHEHASGDYRVRRRECDEAAAALGVRQLRELSSHDLPRVEMLPEPLNRRARHVITENARVLAAVEALRRDDTASLGRLFLESHASMRDDFEISLPEIDTLVDIAASDPDVLGARLTGGGFGGAVVMLCERGSEDRATSRILDRYRDATHRDGGILLPPQS